MSTKKPKYNVQMRHYDHSDGTVFTKVKYFDSATDAVILYLMFMEGHRRNEIDIDDCKVHYKFRTGSTVLAQFWMRPGASMFSSVDKRIAQEYEEIKKLYFASEEMEAA